MKKLTLGVLIFGLATQFVFSQIIELSEVIITANYKYLDAVSSEEVAVPVKKLEQEVALYNVKDSDLYSDEYDTYTISFYIPQGNIVAAYDSDGKIIRTIERFKNVQLPNTVLMAVTERFPNWKIVKDAYKVNYHDDFGITKKEYKIKLENGDKTLTVKVDDNGAFL